MRVLPLQADVEREFSAENFDLQTFPTLSFLPKVQPSHRLFNSIHEMHCLAVLLSSTCVCIHLFSLH